MIMPKNRSSDNTRNRLAVSQLWGKLGHRDNG